MGQRVATMEIGIEMATGGAMRDLAEFGAGVDKTTAQAIRDFNKIDATVKNMEGLTAAATGVTRYGQDVGKTAVQVQRELNRIESAGERMASSLERQLSVFGKTTEEVRALKAETAALAAETASVPMTELATRIRQAEAAIAAEEQAVRSAAAAHALFEAKVREGAAAMDAAAREAAQFEVLVARVANRVDPAATAFARLETDLREAKQAFDAARISGAAFEQEQARITGAAGKLYGPQRQVNSALHDGEDAAKRNGFAMRNLGSQFGDFATQVSLGGGVMRAFSSQAGQVGYALSEFEKGPLASVDKFLTGPWGIAFTVAAVAIPPLVEGLFKAEDASEALKKEQSSLAAYLDKTTGKVREQVGALALLTRAKEIEEQVGTARAAYQSQRANVRGAIIGAFQPIETADPLYGTRGQETQLSMNAATQKQVFGFLKDYETGLINIRQLYGQIDQAAAGTPALRGLRDDLLSAAAATEKAAGKAVNLTVEQGRIAIAAGTASAAQRALVARYTESTRSVSGLIEKQVALETATTAAAKAHAQYDIVREHGQSLNSADAAAVAQYKTDLTAASQAVNAAEAAEKAAREATRAHKTELRDAAKAAREFAAENEKIAAAVTHAIVAINSLKLKDYSQTVGASLEALTGQRTITIHDTIAAQDAIKDQVREQQDAAAAYALSVQKDQLGALHTINQVLKGGFHDLGQSIPDALSQVGRALGALGIGGSSGGLGGAISSLSAAVGQALPIYQAGQEIANVLSIGVKALGIEYSKTGQQIGGLLGGIIGGFFKSTKKASSTIGFANGDLDILTTTGNSTARKKAAGDLGDSVIEALRSIADQVGGTLNGTGSASLGIRKNDIVFDPSGAGRTKGAGVLNFGEDQEAAVRAALADLITDGAITGLSAAATRLLQNGGDVQAQLAKVLNFQGVFASLKQEVDPIGYAVEQLDKQFSILRKTFAEASASADELAQLEHLYQIKRGAIAQDAAEKGNDRLRLEAQLLDAQGNAASALALNRQIELSTMDASLRTLQQQIYAAQDAAKAADAAKQLQAAWAGVADTIMDEVKRIRGLAGAESGGNFVSLMGQFNAATAAARAGDMDVAKTLPQLSKTLLDAAALAASSRQELDRVQGDVAGALEGVNNAIDGFGSTDTSTADLAALTVAAVTQAASAATTSGNALADVRAALDDLKRELVQMRTDNNAGTAAVASGVGAIKRTLDSVTAASGGEAISVAGIAA